MKTAITDLRGKGRWTEADYTRHADLWIVASTWTEKPTPARTLAHLSASYLTLDGQVAGEPGTLNNMIGSTMSPLGPALWTSADGRMTLVPVDITRRHAVSLLADLVCRSLGAFDGLNLDYFTPLGWAIPGYDDAFWEKYANCLSSWVEQMRALKPAWIFTGQNHRVDWWTGCLNGLYLEQDLTSFGQTFESHARDVEGFRSLSQMSKREVVTVAELRSPERYPSWYVTAFKAWCEANGAFASIGRDASAAGTVTA